MCCMQYNYCYVPAITTIHSTTEMGSTTRACQVPSHLQLLYAVQLGYASYFVKYDHTMLVTLDSNTDMCQAQAAVSAAAHNTSDLCQVQ